MILLKLFLIYASSIHVISCFVFTPCTTTKVGTSTSTGTSINDNNDSNENKTREKKKQKGYKFGDMTKSFINKITNEEEYEFGDLSKHLDKQVKSRIATLNNKEEYKFGDLTKFLIHDFTHENNNDGNSTTIATSQYEFGDITKEMIRRIKTKNYTMEDLLLLIKTLMSIGVSFSPIASFLPIKVLVDLLNYSIVGDVGGKAVQAISIEIDKRMKKAIVGDESYQIGDLTKRNILKYIGKEEYTFGDITKRVMTSMDDYVDHDHDDITHKRSVNGNISSNTPSILIQDDFVSEEMEAWDRRSLNAIQKEDK